MSSHVHFLGIGGSGISAVAQLAHQQGFVVTGCDLQTDTPYLAKVTQAGIPVEVGHHPNHLVDIDFLAASPAAFYQTPLHPELATAIKEKKALTWQKFLGDHLHPGKKVISIAGTHGKSTTTAMASLLFEAAHLDPSVMIGATIPSWHNNCRAGLSPYFITESDEFFDNFLNYHPDVIILNNIEPDHPDYFKSEEQLYTSFRKFLSQLQGDRVLIFNQDSPGIQRLFSLPSARFFTTTTLIGYSLNFKPLIPTPNSITASITSTTPTSTHFTISSPYFGLENKVVRLQQPGNFNVSNALGVIALGLLEKIPFQLIKKSLAAYSGIGRRLEVISRHPQNILVYDDYAHHPTAIRATLQALRQRHPHSRIIAVAEPHSFSRTHQLLPLYHNAFTDADEVIIAPIFPARDTHNYGITASDIVTVSGHPQIQTLSDFPTIVDYLHSHITPRTVIAVMGAGKSYQLSRLISSSLQHDSPTT